MELAPHVQEKLHTGHKLTAVVEAGLVQEFIKTTRVIALIEVIEEGKQGGEQALLIFQTARVPVHSAIDLSIEQVLPIDSNLKCELDTSSTDVDTDVLVNITSGKVRLLFEMPFSQRTNTFVSEVLRAAEVISKRRGPPPEFAWLLPYQQSSSSNTSNARDLTELGLSVPATSSDTLAPDTISLGDVAVDVGHIPPSPYLDPVFNNTDSSSLHHDGDRSPDLGVNRHNIAKGISPTPIAARESHIRHQMALREDSYTDIHNFTVFAGTWNVNGRSPTVGLAEWLSMDEDPPDVYGIGFQELDLNTETFLFNNTPKEQEWLNAVLNGIHPKAKYQKVRLVRLVGMMLIVLVQEKHLAYVRNVASDTVGTGIMNKMGNKGAVSVRLDLHSTSICFVNAHLAAHQEELERRNEDHDCIFQRTCFNLNINSPPKTIKDHDHIYFIGDMNYRINPCDVNIREVAKSGELKILLEHEQLTQQRTLKRIFHNFKEGKITFKPTFKYDVDSDEWDSSEKARLPAWCDRILWHGEGIAQLVYRSHPALKISDHKPVSAVFQAGIKVIDTRRYRRIYEEVMKKLDKLENEFLPQVTIDTTEIILEPVKFLQPQTKYLTIANTGQVPVQFEFIKKLNDTSFCKSWLSIRPYVNFIMPGDKCDVALEVLVDKRTAAQLNSGADKLYDILVLHLEGGKDLFITITGDYERSCFGSSINALVHMNKPFKEVPMAKLIDLESKQPKDLSEMPYAVPKELWYLVDHLHSHALQVEGLFTYRGLLKEIVEIRTSLDEGVPNDLLPGSVHSVAEALLLFLEALPEPVIPYNLYQAALDATPNFSLCKDIILKLPDYHRNVFTYLMAFLKELLNHSEDNNLDVKTLALVFGSILLREPVNTASDRRTSPQAVERKKQTFVHHFLMNDYE
ncbi:inositol polyphosphate 5-phosphatase OCRL isoform X2 [Procambarus clarkii]|uniref:inositol polyphosphate 5-phosphatase OCRL isoform X2 n=1 Tax=Procambarus clarkii TaxID=6728 RepID=UPI001E672765|nr:inositol polyphosphate 5-phosphatase OCRL-like isoform X2 [Procambarus clarkii]